MDRLSDAKIASACAVTLLAALASAPSISSTPRDELEFYTYHNLDLIGTFRSNGTWVGCFQLPDGSLRLAKTGAYIGRNSGKITRISTNWLAVTELRDVNHGELLEDTFLWPMKVMTLNMGTTACAKARMARHGAGT
jgi:Tfp pilus assembly protein PilP